MWGTILHEDSQLNRLMPKRYGKYTINTGLKQYESHPQGRIRGAWLSVNTKLITTTSLDSVGKLGFLKLIGG